MQQQLLYKDLARYYDLIYSWKDYKKEAEQIMDLIKQFQQSSSRDLLEVACGTGKHLEFFKQQFNCMGIDINEGMLEIARKRLQDVELKQSDMTNMDLGKQFDVITCLFSSIGYVKTEKNLLKTLENFVKHLKPGGIVIFEPWFNKETFTVGTPHMTTHDGEDIKIARLNVSAVEGNISILDMHYLVAEKDKEVIYFSDRHELGMFENDRILELIKEAGLEAKLVKESFRTDRGLFVGIKKLDHSL